MIQALTPQQPPPDAEAGDELTRRDELAAQLRRLVALRFPALAGIALALPLARGLDWIRIAWPPALLLALLLAFNLSYRALHRLPLERTLRAVRSEALLQLAVDLLGLGLLLLCSGGLANPLSGTLLLPVLLAALLLERRSAYALTALALVLAVLLGLPEEVRGWSEWNLGPAAPILKAPPSHAWNALALGITLLAATFLATSIMERLRARGRDAGLIQAELAERLHRLASTERCNAAERQRLQASLHSLQDGVLVLGLDGQVLLSNPAAQRSILPVLDTILRQAGVPDRTTPILPSPLGARREALHAADRPGASGPSAAKISSFPPATHTPNGAGKPGGTDTPQGGAEGCALLGGAPCLSQISREAGGRLPPEALAYLSGKAQTLEAAPRLLPPTAPRTVTLTALERSYEVSVGPLRNGPGEEILGLILIAREQAGG